MVTKRQKEAVGAIEAYVAVAPKFKGNLDNYKEVSEYLSKWTGFLYINEWSIGY